MSATAFADRMLAFDPSGSNGLRLSGRVIGASGLSVELAGIARHAGLGSRLIMEGRDYRQVHAEVVSFRNGIARAMAFDDLEGIGPGTEVRLVTSAAVGAGLTGVAGQAPQVASLRSGGTLGVDESWLGRIVDPLGRPLDHRGPLRRGRRRSVRATPPDSASRARLGPPLDLGVRALDLFTTMRAGQRLGLFAGSGVGKSTLMSMLARQARCDVAVIALVGERGREVREFVEDDLGEDGLARSVVVAATSDTPPLMRREAAYAAMTIAETFRDRGKSVLLMMDSITRFCLALREIGLSAGEPPATRGYPPSVFAELPRLLERAGPGAAATAHRGLVGSGRIVSGREAGEGDASDPIVPSGSITGLFTVLVEGDDHNEPVADAVRGILDGHVVLDRRIGESGRYPAIDVLRSLSRANGCLVPADAALVTRARSILSRWNDMADMVRLGAYRSGSDAAVDEAIRLAPRIEEVLRQGRTEKSDLRTAIASLRLALGEPDAA